MVTESDAAEQPKQVQCEVTGRWVPADEIILIQGRRVCAEGKLILLDRLRSGEAMPGELERPTVLRRFGALLADGFCLFIGSAIVGGVLGIMMFQSLTEQRSLETLRTYQYAILVVIGSLQLAYFVLFHGAYGQTPGKMLAGIRVISIDGSPITTRTAALRALYYIGPKFVNQFVGILMITPNDLRTSQLITGVGAALVGGYALANVLSALLDRHRQRALHDRWAGTRVVVA